MLFPLSFGTTESFHRIILLNTFLSVLLLPSLHLFSFFTCLHTSVFNTENTHTPAILATRSASWPLAVLERLGLRCLLPPCAERMLRIWTSVALKKATMKGCLLWGPLRPTSPATHGFTLWPAGGDTYNTHLPLSEINY